jgi:gamma-glutamyltranspeptidase
MLLQKEEQYKPKHTEEKKNAAENRKTMRKTMNPMLVLEKNQ